MRYKTILNRVNRFILIYWHKIRYVRYAILFLLLIASYYFKWNYDLILPFCLMWFFMELKKRR